MDAIWKRVYLSESWIARFQEVADNFLSLLELPAKLWQQLRLHGLSGTFCVSWQTQDVSSSKTWKTSQMGFSLRLSNASVASLYFWRIIL